MTDTTATPEDEPQEHTQPEALENNPETTETPDEHTGREAAKYRRRLRETESALEAAQGALEAAQRALVDNITTANGVRPAGLWAVGTQLADLLDEHGNVDPAKVREAADAAAATLGLSRAPRPDPNQGRSPAANRNDPWVEAFTPQRR